MIVIFLLVAACKTGEKDSTSIKSSPMGKSVSTRDFFDSTGESWTGRLIMPMPNERKSDGGVWFEVYDAPGNKSFSQPIWLTWNPNNSYMKEYYKRTVIDVTVSNSDLEQSRTSKNRVPERLNGLKRVSFLESLAGGRTNEHAEIIRGQLTADSIEVFIPKARLSENVLLIDSEPVQITGKSVMLLKFVQKKADQVYEVQSWQGNGFNGDKMLVRYQKPQEDPSQVASQPTIDGIEQNPANVDGWYAFGDEENGSFEVRALEPRAAMMLDRANAYSDGARYIDVGNFSNIGALKGQVFTSAIQKTKQYTPPRGLRGLVVHIFGGIAGINGDAPLKIPLTGKSYYTGHFAFGVAEILKDPFTGNGRLDIEYRQIYANNSQSILSGAIKWHNYSGSLRRGWMYSRPISDAVIWHPALSHIYKFRDGEFDPLEGILQELNIMAARFRSGDGTGTAKVTAITSCVQDSNQAAFISLSRFLDWIKSSSEAQAMLENRISTPDAQKLRDLVKIAELYQSRIIRFAGLRSDWREARNAELAISKNPTSKFDSIISAIASRKFLTPDWANREILKLFYDEGAIEWFVRTNQVGGIKPNISPTAPGFN